MGRAGRSVALMAAAAAVGVAAPAAAHPAIDEARERYGWADFGGALAALVRAEQAERLSKEELHELLALRATIHFAMRSGEAFDKTLRTLASVAPDHRFEPDLPPPFLQAWERARDEVEPLSVQVEVHEMAGGTRIQATVEGSARSLVRRGPRVRARVVGGRWRGAYDGVISLDGSRGAVIEYYAEVIGPGRVVLARNGSLRHPRVVRLLGLEPTGTSSKAATDEGEPIDRLPWFIAGGAALVAVATSIALIVVTTRDDSTHTVIGAPSFSTR